MNSKLIGSLSLARQVHGLYTEAIKPISTNPHLNTFAIPSLGHLNRWSQEQRLNPHFITPPYYNSIDTLPKVDLESKTSITKKYVFHKSKVTQLKAMAAVQGVHNPTTAQVLNALVLKCAKASVASCPPKPSPLFQSVQMRPKVVPQLPKTAITDLRVLKEQIMKRKMGSKQRQENLELESTKNMLVLVDDPSGDTIEAQVTLDLRCMARFQQDKQLLKFASL